MKKSTLRTLAGICLAIFTGCSNQDSVSDQVVLKVGRVQMSEHEYDRNLAKYINYLAKPNLTEAEIQNFNQNITDDALITALAYERGYDTARFVTEVVDIMSKFILVKYDGYHWKKAISPKLEVSEEELENAWKKSDHIYYVEILGVNSADETPATDEAMSNIKTADDFRKTADAFKKERITELQSINGRWPIVVLQDGNDQLLSMNEGDVSKPVRTTNGVMVFHLFKKEKVNQPPLNTVREELRMNLKGLKESTAFAEFENKYHSDCKPTFDDTVLEKTLQHIREGKSPETLKADSPIATYWLEGKKISVSATEFLNFIIYYPNAESMNTVDNVRTNLHRMISTEYRMLEVIELGLLNDKKFLLEKNNFRNRMMLEHYVAEEIAVYTSVSDEEISAYYKTNQAMFMEPAAATFSVLEFIDEKSAADAGFIIDGAIRAGNLSILSDTSAVKGMTSYIPQQSISRAQSDLPPGIFGLIYSMPVGKVSLPVNVDGKIRVYAKLSETGKVPIDIAIVKQQIHNAVKATKVFDARRELASKLREQYQVETDNTSEYARKSLSKVTANLVAFL